MSALTATSEVILRHEAHFTHRHVLFAGELQDTLPVQLQTRSSKVHTLFYHHWQNLHQRMAENARFGLLADATFLNDRDTLIYVWPKNKPEARFQLQNLLSLLPEGVDIFIVGENRSGVRSAEALTEQWTTLKKIDNARRCGLYYGQLTQRPDFNIDAFWQQYLFNALVIKTLPGVFSHQNIDAGSKLLISTFRAHMKGHILDIGCGAGLLAAALASQSPKVHLTLTDVSAAALAASQATLAANGLQGNVFASNIWSDINRRFDLIISNPPFHEGRKTSLDAAQQLICGAPAHLNRGGELRIVANAFLPYPQLLDETFGSHQVLTKSSRFNVYSAIWKGPNTH